jgi:hypothetical protein
LSELMLSDSDTKEIVSNASSKEERRSQSGQGSGDGGKDLDEGVGCDTGVEACRVVVEQVKDTAG